ncbi:MAG: TlpA disulfide reductase family protein [Candidatus Pedobacter colombiensis]|uniref:TlpA disulfide reductase family protein n=1 Tax=Candidatus Pedobacter colombiensis TaxID=3121371 RepID=A0AAJ5WFC3_9SPHI|nr:TlpA disulfide reductase family protein [Pedobacter sp.]WEK21537.1 MAG: TlpA disulfide reductase family protein [Pedobacter sp.]
MKTLTLAALMIAPMVVSAQKSDFTLNGTISNLKSPTKVYLSYEQDGKEVLDSSVVDKGGFQFKGALNGPEMVELIVDHRNTGINKLGKPVDVLRFYLANEIISVNAVDSIKKGTISGSNINTEYEAYKTFFVGPEKSMDAVENEFLAASKDKQSDPAYKKEMQTRYEKAANEKKALQRKFAKSHPASFFSLVALTEAAGNSIDVKTIEPIFKALSAEVRNTSVGQEFAKEIEFAKAILVGGMAPDFTQNDLNDKPISLSSFKGKYVLIDFWASWCKPCRAENPNVVDAYNRYKYKNFTVLGVSLDNPGKKELWLAAVVKDNLTWTQVSDLKGWNNAVAKQYGISSIPQNVLIDPSGKVVAKNLRGDALHQKLQEVIGSGTGE